jgi:hypothetical protein
MRVRISIEGWVEVKRGAVQRVAKCQSQKLCLACEQPLGDCRVVRGCHERCAKATYRAIESGKTTDAKRIEEGKWLTAEQGGRKPSNPVSIELAGG